METSLTDYKLYHGAWVYCGRPDTEQRLTKKQAKALLAKGGLFVRNVYDFDCKEETSFWMIVKDHFDGIPQLKTSIRTTVRKSLKTYDFKRIPSLSEFVELAYPVYREAMLNYKVKAIPDNKKKFTADCASRTNGEYWVGVEKTTGEPAVIAVNQVCEDMCEEVVLKTRPKFMHNSTYPTNGLIFEMYRYYLQERGVKMLCIGARSLTEHSNIQHYVTHKFNYRKAYCRMEIFYQPWLGILVKLLYPFREHISILKVKSLLRMEAMRRNEY